MGAYGQDRQWAEQYMPEVKRIIGPLLLESAPLEIDRRQATDLIILTARDMRIGVRLRRPGYAERYPWDVTFRSGRDNGTQTELDKVYRGWGDWLFYGHVGEVGGVDRWMIVDLDAFRYQVARRMYPPRYAKQTPNGDGTHFVAFDVRLFGDDPPVLVAASHDVARHSPATMPAVRQAVPA